jgi:DNA repair photolyase
MVKERAPELLEAELSSPKWKSQLVMMSGVTDCYQPIERKMELTRRCLQVLAKFRNPVGILTKNRLVTRDIDVLKELAAHNCVAANLSITSLDPQLQRILEPRTSPPAARLEAVQQLREAGIPVGVMVAPIIPGINDHEMPAVLDACAKAGAKFAGYVLLRLPWAVAPLFERWLEEYFPERKAKVLGRVREMRGGAKLYDSRWSKRQTGEGIFAEQIATMFDVAARRAGLDGPRPQLSTAAFRRPHQQLTLL